jgi:hypothetical protein
VRRALALSALAALALAGCKGEPDALTEAKATDVPKALSGSVTASGVVESQFGTPVKDRVATIGLLNKRNNLEQDLVMKSGESRRSGNVIVKLGTCEKTAPWERPRQTGAFVQVFVEERASSDQPLSWRKVFSGWLFKESPSLNVVEHPVYDVWVKDCAMKFPGEEEEASASASSAPKATGSDSAPESPAPSASPSAKPSPKPSAKPPVT